MATLCALLVGPDLRGHGHARYTQALAEATLAAAPRVQLAIGAESDGVLSTAADEARCWQPVDRLRHAHLDPWLVQDRGRVQGQVRGRGQVQGQGRVGVGVRAKGWG